MAPDWALPHSQQLSTSLYSEPDRFNPCPPFRFLKIHLNIILPSTPGPSKCSPCLRFPHHNPVYSSPSPYMLHALSISFLPTCETWKNIPKNMLCCSIQISNIIYLPSPQLPVCFIEAHWFLCEERFESMRITSSTVGRHHARPIPDNIRVLKMPTRALLWVRTV